MLNVHWPITGPIRRSTLGDSLLAWSRAAGGTRSRVMAEAAKPGMEGEGKMGGSL